jgi:large subunit ribosomal protein L33
MARGGKRIQVKLKSTESSYCYYTTKNKTKTPQRLEFRKYDPFVRRHVIFKEAK